MTAPDDDDARDEAIRARAGRWVRVVRETRPPWLALGWAVCLGEPDDGLTTYRTASEPDAREVASGLEMVLGDVLAAELAEVCEERDEALRLEALADEIAAEERGARRAGRDTQNRLRALLDAARAERDRLAETVTAYLRHHDQHLGDDYYPAERRAVRLPVDGALRVARGQR